MDGDGDRADRWYPVPLDATEAEARELRQGGGYRTASEAAEAAILRASNGEGTS